MGSKGRAVVLSALLVPAVVPAALFYTSPAEGMLADITEWVVWPGRLVGTLATSGTESGLSSTADALVVVGASGLVWLTVVGVGIALTALATRWRTQDDGKSRRGKMGAAYRQADLIVIHPVHRTSAGTTIPLAPVFRLPASVETEQIGLAVLAAIAAARIDEYPEDWKGDGQLVPGPAGVRTWGALPPDAVCCVFIDTGKSLIVRPLEESRDGKQTASDSSSERDVVIKSPADAVKIGESIRGALTGVTVTFR
jgi:hypothetical protein